MIYPLPLVPFEEYMFLDDRPSYPMSFFLKFVFSGECEPRALESALQSALRRHPLLSARIEEVKRNRFHWSQSPVKEIAVRWVASDGQMLGSPIDLFSEPGFRVSAQRHEEETELVLQFHHSCCDGIGALRFCEDLLVGYAATVSERDFRRAPRDAFRPLDSRRLRGRGYFGLTPWKLLKMAHRQARGLLGARQFLMRRPVPLQPIALESDMEKLPSEYPAEFVHQLTETETASFVTAARKAGATVNDLLARDLFLAIRDYRSSRQLSKEDEWLRLSIPMNLRSPADEQLPAANMVSMIVFDRRPQDIANAQELLDSIHFEMQLIKKNQLGLTFPLSLQFSRPFPGAISRLRKLCEKPICRGTAVLSNLGRPLEDVPLARRNGKIVAGNMTLERMVFLPPIRPHTMAAFGAFTYADRLHLALHFDQRGLTAVDAEEFFVGFVSRMRESGNTDSR